MLKVYIVLWLVYLANTIATFLRLTPPAIFFGSFYASVEHGAHYAYFLAAIALLPVYSIALLVAANMFSGAAASILEDV
jgi:hypothetical protein